MITLVGVGHVFNIGSAVREIIKDRKPGLVCVELDKNRYDALLDERRTGRSGQPISYRMLANFQRRIAKSYGSKPGDEMLAAVDTAKELNINIAFIDMDARYTFSRMFQMMTFEEKVRMMSAGIFGFFSGKNRVEKELERFETDHEGYLNEFGRMFPTVKTVLIDERDEYMANAIRQLYARWGRLVAVVGDGHINGIRSRLERCAAPGCCAGGTGNSPDMKIDTKIDVIRLNDIIDNSWKRTGNCSVSISFFHGAAH